MPEGRVSGRAPHLRVITRDQDESPDKTETPGGEPTSFVGPAIKQSWMPVLGALNLVREGQGQVWEKFVGAFRGLAKEGL